MRTRNSVLCCIAGFLCFFCLFRSSGRAQEKTIIVGTGSNVPVRLYEAWTNEFDQQNEQIQVRYMPLGSSESIREMSKGEGDFGGGEVPLTNEISRPTPTTRLSAIPVAVISIVPIYNLPRNPVLNFTGDLLADIYLGKVKNWKDPRIAILNREVELPDLLIRVVHRTAGKGSNYVFSDFLAKTNREFRLRIRRSPSPDWPVGISTNRGEDMIAMVASTPGSIGYVEVNSARSSGVSIGRVKNAAGKFLLPNPATVEAACNANLTSTSNLAQMDLTNPSGVDSYPIASFTWIYVSTPTISSARLDALKQFLRYCLEDGQNVAKRLGYTPLPKQLTAKALEMVNSW